MWILFLEVLIKIKSLLLQRWCIFGTSLRAISKFAKGNRWERGYDSWLIVNRSGCVLWLKALLRDDGWRGQGWQTQGGHARELPHSKRANQVKLLSCFSTLLHEFLSWGEKGIRRKKEHGKNETVIRWSFITTSDSKSNNKLRRKVIHKVHGLITFFA